MEKANAKSNSSVAIILAVWALVLLVAFLSYRGSDVGQIGKLLGNLGGGPLGGSGVGDSIVGSLITLLISISWFGIGNFAVSFIKTSKSESHSHVLELATKTAVGAAVWSLIWFFIGVADAYSKPVGAVAVVIGLVFAGLGMGRIREAKAESRTPERAAVFDKIVLALIAVPVALAFIAALAPPTAKDALLYHFAVPKAFISQGSNAFVEGNIASYLALGNEMHVVWAMLLGGFVGPRAAEAAAGATIWMFFPLLLAAVFGWAREIGISRRWSLIAVLMVAAVPSVYHVAASAYIDVAMALFVTLAVYALSRWWQTLETGWLILIGVFLGAALSAKLTTVFVIAAFALVILLRVRKAKESEPDDLIRILIGGFAALILAGFIASPWYLRTWQQTGSPVFPFYMSILPGEAPGWDVERSNLFQAMNSQYGGIVKSPLDYLLSPWNVSVMAQPEQPIFFDGVLGVAFLIGLSALFIGWLTRSEDGGRLTLILLVSWLALILAANSLLGTRPLLSVLISVIVAIGIVFYRLKQKVDLPSILSVDTSIAFGVAAIVFLFWLFSSQQLRYLIPILPLLAVGIAASVEKITEKRSPLYMAAKYGISVAAVFGILTAFAWFCQRAPLRVVLGGETRDQYLMRNLDYYSYYQALNTTTAPDARVWLINMRRDTYNLDRPVFSDYLFEDWTLRKMIWESRSVQELKAKAAAMNVQYVLTRHDFLFDYDRSTIVDDKKPRAENEAKLKIAKEFVLDKANTVFADEKFSLIKVF